MLLNVKIVQNRGMISTYAPQQTYAYTQRLPKYSIYSFIYLLKMNLQLKCQHLEFSIIPKKRHADSPWDRLIWAMVTLERQEQPFCLTSEPGTVSHMWRFSCLTEESLKGPQLCILGYSWVLSVKPPLPQCSQLNIKLNLWLYIMC